MDNSAASPPSLPRKLGLFDATMIELARSVRARVLVDEVYVDLLFEDAPATRFQAGIRVYGDE